MLKNLSTKMGQTKPPVPELSLVVKELSMDKDTQIEWSSIDNIIDLTEKIPTIRFFASDSSEDSTKGCVRCQTCFEYLCTRDGRISRLKKQDECHATEAHVKK